MNPILFIFLLSLSLRCSCDTLIWPLPKTVSSGTTTLVVSNPLTFTSTGYSSATLNNAYTRYANLIFYTPTTKEYVKFSAPAQPFATLTAVNVNVVSNSESLQLGTDESYTLTIPSSGGAATISAPTVYGALHALETLSQLIYAVAGSPVTYQLPNAPWTISDSPRFQWRGVLLDTSRWFYPLADIYRILDAMSYSKFNVLHWHVTDSQSFPIESVAYPELSAKGAYSASEVYTQDNVRALIAYGQQRGIRIVPEFDAPGHAMSWGKGYPGLTVCAGATPWSTYCAEPPCGQLDPTNTSTYDLLDGFLKDMAALFTDNHVHLGADEVNFNCWDSSPAIQNYKKANGLTDTDLLQTFEDKEHSIAVKYNKIPMNWEEVVLDFKLNIASNTVIQAWKGASSVGSVAQKGYKVIASPYTSWYLDCGTGDWLGGGQSWCDPYKTWQTVYDYEPTSGVQSQYQANIIGGEPCIWSEVIDSSNVDGKLWPRAAAAAERLWSPVGGKSANALIRISWFRQLLLRRGIAAKPVQPEFCLLNPTQC